MFVTLQNLLDTELIEYVTLHRSELRFCTIVFHNFTHDLIDSRVLRKDPSDWLDQFIWIIATNASESSNAQSIAGPD